MNSETHITGWVDLGEFIEAYLPEDDVLASARLRAEQLGCPPVSCATGSLLSFLAASLQARAIVEIGTGAGVSGLYLLRGMAKDGVLTSIDIEPEFHRSARQSFLDAGYPAGRTRLIIGRAMDVLSRLTTGGYDMVFADASRVEYPGYFDLGVQLLRPGGVIAFHNVLAAGRIADPTRREPELLALRDVARAVREDKRLVPTLLPVGNGLLVAAVATPED
ncbi:MAG: O-methyltransferase [Saccharomonospora viridis]|uniref:Predicted O-methyltransferase n=1 Tax=Saccharomonospora viridis (strain ATCC 15386 / DSM 43017 / JCM 3036 / CCUG 5913 / NBRC 12207 / NCIMB 9602 / P101) TaxID=471857 RepID=C7MVJ4_SACVD|nr:O-methyltransferase [Saccharomonospora viridis]ACU95713.1 predicted O-methyltransferase [Saccharomonospora viridis DSM 43017]